MDQEPIVNALIASFLALGGAVDEAMLQRTGNNLRALIYDPDSALLPLSASNSTIACIISEARKL